MFRFAACLTLAVCLVRPTAAQVVFDSSLRVVEYATGFAAPTQIRFFGGGNAFVLEKNTGRVRVTGGGAASAVALDLNVANDSERGLLGLAVDPNFAANRQVYLYYSATTGGDGGAWAENRLSRFTYDGVTGTLGGETLLRTFGTAANGDPDGPNHDGGPILFGQDGKLYGVTGDLNRNGAEQNNQNAANNPAFVGGIYRLNSDGSTPNDNPFVNVAGGQFDSYYAYGIRNSFGLAIDPVNGQLWDTENGPDVYDEINLVPRGLNSGWTKIMGPDSRDPEGVGDLVNLQNSVYSDPEFSFLNPVGITSMTFLSGSALGAAYQDIVIAGDTNTGNLYQFTLNAARDGFVLGGGLADLVADDVAERNAVRWGQGFGVVTDTQVGADGLLYVLSLSSGTVYQISTTPEAGTWVLVTAGGLFLLRRRSR